MIVARHEVPGKRPSKRPSRRVRHDPGATDATMHSGIISILLNDTAFEISSSNLRIGAHTRTNHTVPYGTALLGCAVPGTSC
jgi:hypothetical protein